MAKISLRVYNREVEGMIEGGQLEEAIAHCQHILKAYSMHVETYRLLGKAFLESQRYADAADIFQRVLMAVPDDFVAHVGMSIIRDDENKLDDAIWHMERAFEVQPSNPAIQGELRRLYGRRDGIEPPKIRLSRDALANMYSQGELFTQAVAEIRAILAEDPNRPDMQVMLARVYYRSGQKVEAAELAAGLLKKYPYCVDALRVLVEVLPGTKRAENAQVYQQRLQLLDPYSSFTAGSVFNADKVSDASVTVERLEYKTGSIPSQTNWADTLGIQLESGAEQAPNQPWLPAGGSAEPAAEPAGPAPADLEPAPELKEGDSIPDWMRTAGWKESSGETREAPAETGEEPPAEPIAAADIPDWLKSLAPPNAGAGQGPNAGAGEPAPAFAEEAGNGSKDLPDWLKSATAGTEGTTSAEKPPLADGAAASKEEPQSDAGLDWLEGLADKTAATADELSAKPEETKDETPDWFSRAANQPATPVETPEPAAAPPEAPAPAAEDLFSAPEERLSPPPDAGLGNKPLSIEDDTLAWLEGLAAKQGAKPEELLTKPEDRTETPPDWIQAAVNEQALAPAPEEPIPQVPKEPSPASPQPVSPDDDMTITSWLSKLDVEEELKKVRAPKEPAAPPAEELPDWMKDLNAPPSAGEPAQPEQDMPDWLHGAAGPAATAEQSPQESAPEAEMPPLFEGNAPVTQAPTPTAPHEWIPAEKAETVPTPPPEDNVQVQPAPLPQEPPAPSVTPKPPKVTGILAKVPPQDKDAELLAGAQSALEGKQLKEAMQEYARLIKKGRLLDEVIHDLREAQYRFPVDIIIWQTLGDAYMRANRLQDALDAYNKAEELLR